MIAPEFSTKFFTEFFQLYCILYNIYSFNVKHSLYSPLNFFFSFTFSFFSSFHRLLSFGLFMQHVRPCYIAQWAMVVVSVINSSLNFYNVMFVYNGFYNFK